jgi:hypothetical protein
MPNFEAHIEANMDGDDTADYLSTDQSWLEAQWTEAKQIARDAGKTPTGDPVYVSFSKKGPSPDGFFYDFLFSVPVA